MKIYPDLSFPVTPQGRPYTFINMVTTIDGKILTGDRDEPVIDLGSALDHETMRSLEEACDAVMVGAGSVRATPKIRYRSNLLRIIVSGSADLDFSLPLFTDAPEKAVIVTSKKNAARVPEGLKTILSDGNIDFQQVLAVLRDQLRVRCLLVEGGSELNASLLTLDLIDELFLTLAPKIKLGRNVPTYAGGEPLPRSEVQQFELVSCKPVGDEVFLRYRRKDLSQTLHQSRG